jgi:hypothetical protein
MLSGARQCGKKSSGVALNAFEMSQKFLFSCRGIIESSLFSAPHSVASRSSPLHDVDATRLSSAHIRLFEQMFNRENKAIDSSELKLDCDNVIDT